MCIRVLQLRKKAIIIGIEIRGCLHRCRSGGGNACRIRFAGRTAAYVCPVDFGEESKNMPEITKETLIGDVLDMDMGTAEFFMEIGMHCLGCPASRGESIEEACMVHGLNSDELVAKLNDYFKAN